ncbi:hypothetical protein M3Y94_00170100 [Aphelenchoides besseyi]|nr:hypothetical protein M3Y94_00170100 [Aphelenchoides besseyi]
MGNADSKSSGHNSRRHTPTEHDVRKTRRSLSPSQHLPGRSESLQIKTTPALPIIQNSSASFHTTATASAQHEAAKRRIQQRRAKSFRAPRRSGDSGSFRVSVCPITNLTSNQKKLIQVKWFELDRQGIIDVSQNVCETIFCREPLFLRLLNLQHVSDRSWRFHINFRSHVQRFSEVLNLAIRTLEDPHSTIDRLHEFGASHFYVYGSEDCKKNSKHRIPSAYWETFIFALNKAAKDLQVESSRGSESPSQGYDRRFLLPGDESSQCNSPSPTPSSLSPSPSPISLDPSATPRRYGRSVCPTAAEAWSILANYIVDQIKWGYSNEILLQQMLTRLQAGLHQYSNADDESNSSELNELSIKTESAANGSLSSTSNGSSSSTSSSNTAPLFQNLMPIRQQQTVE